MKKIDDILKVLEQVNAKDIKVYDYENKSPYFDYVILATANDRQSMAAVSYLKKENSALMKNVEGKSGSGWILIDMKDVIVHLFSEEQRKNYNFDDKLLSYKLIKEI